MNEDDNPGLKGLNTAPSGATVNEPINCTSRPPYCLQIINGALIKYRMALMPLSLGNKDLGKYELTNSHPPILLVGTGPY